MASVFAEVWHWQPSEVLELDVDDFLAFFEHLTEIKATQAKAIREANRR